MEFEDIFSMVHTFASDLSGDLDTGDLTESDSETAVQSQQTLKKTVVCVLDLKTAEGRAEREKALQEVKKACDVEDVEFHHVQFEMLDCGGKIDLDLFYKADMAIVDISILRQHVSLFYWLGVRESYGLKGNILVYNEVDAPTTISLKLSCFACGGYSVLSYKVKENGQCVLTDPGVIPLPADSPESNVLLSFELKKRLQEVQIQAKVYPKEKFLADLRKANETLRGKKLANVLKDMRKRLDDPNLVSSEVVLNMLKAFRDIQEYDEMVKLVDDLNKNIYFTLTCAVRHQYAFALNRRNKGNDRDRALNIALEVLKENEVEIL